MTGLKVFRAIVSLPLPSETGRHVDPVAFGQRHDRLLDVVLLADEALEALHLAPDQEK